MTEPAVIRFTDPASCPCTVSVREEEGVVTLGFVLGSTPGVDVAIHNADAVRLARALLTAAGENADRVRAKLPQSRQIGGIIGPY